MSKVFVLGADRRPLNPVHPGRARQLLSSRRAAVFRRFPFTIILKTATADPTVEALRVKVDPGSKTTGLAVVDDASGEVVFAAEIVHRGHVIRRALGVRCSVRRNRRNRHTRYRKPRFQNRQRREGWLPPSLESRIATILTWTRRLTRLCLVAAISQEVVKFDLQKMEKPEMSGVQYQQGTLAGYELREYLLEKWNRQCAYCGAKNVPLQIEHIQSRARGGSDRVGNLTLACEPCNVKKGSRDIREFLGHAPALLQRILAQARAPHKDAAAVNVTRWALYRRLQGLGLPIECGSGGRTKWNRITRGLEKTHWVDAACVGASTPADLKLRYVIPLRITATGHGTRQMCRMDRYGFPRTGPRRTRRVKGFRTGDIVRALVMVGKHSGTYVGRVAVRSNGSFNITTTQGTVQGISHRFCTLLHHSDGYSYCYERRAAFPPVV